MLFREPSFRWLMLLDPLTQARKQPEPLNPKGQILVPLQVFQEVFRVEGLGV